LPGHGTVFKVNAQNGAFTSVAEFGGPFFASLGMANGSHPSGGLIGDGFGWLWGTTKQGGTFQRGTIFKIYARTGRLVTMVNFTGQQGTAVGGEPIGGLTPDGAGNLWGTTSAGGTAGKGSVFKVATRTGAFTSIASFTGAQGLTPGSQPTAGLARDGAGCLWGLTGGEPNFPATIFKVNTATRLLTTVYQFPAQLHEYYLAQESGLVFDGHGAFWGTTANRGQYSRGTIFMITTSGVYSEPFAFTGQGGLVPGNGPVFDSLLRVGNGQLYGVTPDGGIKPDGSPAGGSQFFRIRLNDTAPR
jgi:uncharacterized repeat protein (TIGR03803 family)